jgi:hypothetical protein
LPLLVVQPLDPLLTPITNDIPYVADVLKTSGAAYCAEAFTFRNPKPNNKRMSLVMIHGGKEYDPIPTQKSPIQKLRASGATLRSIINPT